MMHGAQKKPDACDIGPWLALNKPDSRHKRLALKPKFDMPPKFDLPAED